MVEDLKYWSNVHAKCPYCDYDDDGSWELHLQHDGDETENECPNCEEEYMVTLDLTVTYTTQKMESDYSND